MLQSSDLWCWMIWNRIFDVKYNYYGYASAAYWVLQLPMVEAFIPRDEQVTTTKAFIIYPLVLDLNHLDRVCEGLRSKNLLSFFKINLSSSMVLYFFVICSIRTNFASRWKIWFDFWKCVQAKIASFLLLSFRWLFNLRLKVVSLFPTYCIKQILHWSK